MKRIGRKERYESGHHWRGTTTRASGSYGRRRRGVADREVT